LDGLVTLYELWHSETESSYALRYFPDVADYHVRPVDEHVVWSIETDSFEAALQQRNKYLEWSPESLPPVPFEYPPTKRTFLVVYDYGQGGLWAFVDASSPAEIENRFSALQVISHRQHWFTPDEQRLIAESDHYNIDEPSEWLSQFGRAGAV
jgi:hypothetical protein